LEANRLEEGDMMWQSLFTPTTR